MSKRVAVEHPQRGARRPPRRREDHAGRGPAGRHRDRSPARARSRRARRSATSSPKRSSASCRCRFAIAPFDARGREGQPPRRPRLRRLRVGDGHGAGGDRPGGVVVSATDGVQAQTEDAWRAAGDLGMPRMIVITKLDRERADFERTLAEVDEGLRCRGGAGASCRSAPRRTSAASSTSSTTRPPSTTLGERPAGRRPRGADPRRPGEPGARQVHEQLVEGIVVGDDDLMARYLDGETIERHELRGGARPGRGRRHGLPGAVLLGDHRGRRSTASPMLLVELVPAGRPAPAGPRPGRRPSTTEVPRDPDGPPLLAVCKTLSDQHAGRISLCKVVSGTITPTSSSSTRAHAPRSGCTSSRCCAATRPSRCTTRWPATSWRCRASTGRRPATRWPPRARPCWSPSPSPEPPALSMAVRPASRADEDKLMSALQRLAEEDPSLTRHPRRRDAPDRPRRGRRGPPGRHLRAPVAQVRRQRRARGGPHPLPRDDHRDRRGRGPLQEADRRPRPVRRRAPARRAAGARRGVRVPTTRWWAAPSPASTSRPWRRASSRPWTRAG